jgi:hypothetical protein
MGKSWKGDNAWKYKKDKNFQKKQKQKQKGKQMFPIKESDIPNSPFDDPPEYHESFA